MSCLALGVSAVSFLLSFFSYRKDRWRLSLEAWIEAQTLTPGTSVDANLIPGLIRGRLFVNAANTGRRPITIQNIRLQVFKDELTDFRKTELVRIDEVAPFGFVAGFAATFPRCPLQLSENEPVLFEAAVSGLDPLSRSRICIVDVTGRKNPIRVACETDRQRCKRRYFSGS